MALQFNADEIFEIAEQIERNGAAFYRRAAEIPATAGSRDLLLQLAMMEDVHLATFQAMRKALASAARAETVFDPAGEAALYLKEFADGRVFDVRVDPSKRLTGKESPADVLRMAIGLEKDSVLFYVGMRELVAAKFGQDKIEDIIKEEMRHITILSRELAKVS